ncbi:MAG TPA: hypothetical protein VMT46_18845 [Anaerolineaceae bacterium]|nr:hypothetical protein [Anaerolineaceae bacterium]
MKPYLSRLVLPLILILGFLAPGKVQASRGAPSSADFGYGVRVDLDGKQVLESLPALSTLRVDWIGIDFNWSARWPDSQSQPDLQILDQVMQFAQQANISVLLSITNAPAWASTPQGPDPAMTAWFATNLARRYPALRAIELFPQANIRQAWGAIPDPGAYLNLLRGTRAALRDANLDILLAAGGLAPLSTHPDNGDLDDLTFLRGLYQTGGLDQTTVISLRLPELTGDPLQSPENSSPGEGQQHILRHYEEIRQVMLENHHASGILWITHFSGPSGKIHGGESATLEPQKQTLWLIQAYRLMRAQLYIGAAFYGQLNPSAHPEGETFSLIRSDSSRNPFFEVLGRLIAQNNQEFIGSPDFSEPQLKYIHKDRD